MSVASSIETSVSSPIPGRARRAGDGVGDDEQEGTRAPGGARRPRRGPDHGRAGRTADRGRGAGGGGGGEVFRVLEAVRGGGAGGLVSRRRGRPSNRRHPDAVREAALAAIRERYADFGPTLAAEKLAEVNDLRLGRETVRRWMAEAGLRVPRKERGRRVTHPRHRRDCLGELAQG